VTAGQAGKDHGDRVRGPADLPGEELRYAKPVLLRRVEHGGPRGLRVGPGGEGAVPLILGEHAEVADPAPGAATTLPISVM
jgi:hypothetical protein